MSMLNKAVQTQEAYDMSYNQINSGVAFNGISGSSNYIPAISEKKNVIDFCLGVFDFFSACLLLIFFASVIYIFLRTLLTYKSGGIIEAKRDLLNDGEKVVNLLLWVKKLFLEIFFWLFNIIKNYKWLVLGFIGLLLTFNFGLLEVKRVLNGYRLVNIRNNKVLNPGIHLISPLFSEYILANVADYQFEIPEVTADSKYPELQDVILHLNVSYHLESDKLQEFFARNGAQMTIWRTTNEIVSPRVIEKVKQVVKNYSFKEVHLKQEEIKAMAISEIKKVLEPIGITLNDLNIVNIRISSKFVDVFGDKEILDERKKLETAQLEQEKIQTERELEMAEREKKKKIIEAEGISEANRLINSQQITDRMLELKRIENEKAMIEKWNGITPTQVGGNFNLLP